MAKNRAKLYTLVCLPIPIPFSISISNSSLTHSSWFSVCMGTGIVSILLHNLPYNGQWLYYLSIVVFCRNIGLFVSFFIISVIRYTLYPEIWWVMIKHPAQSLFLGTFPMALATIVNMIVFVCVPAWGERFVQLVSIRRNSFWKGNADAIQAWGLWWIDVALSLACCFYMPFVMYFPLSPAATS